MTENKTQPTKASVDAFINAIENTRRKTEAWEVLRLYQEITGLPAVMWGPSIIGFGSMPYAYDSGRKGIMPVAAFSPRKASMTLYVGERFPDAENLYAQLGKHKKSKACLYINKLDDVNVDVLRKIIALDFALWNEST